MLDENETPALIGVEEALALLERAVAEKGEDYVYPDHGRADTDYRTSHGSCVYQTRHTKQPACIVGHVLDYAGRLGDVVEAGLNQNGVTRLTVAGFGLKVFTHRAGQVLGKAQSSQDNGGSWGEALAAARAAATR